MTKDNTILFLDQDKQKRDYWNAVQGVRIGFEQKWHYLMQRVLNRQYTELAGRIREDNFRGDFSIDGALMGEAYRELYKDVGGDFARREFNRHRKSVKQETEDEWLMYLEDYVNSRVGFKISKVNDYSSLLARDIIKNAINDSVEQGLGAKGTAKLIVDTLIGKSKDINVWRALRIARTETVSASNIGSYVGAEGTGLPMVKYWIATYDSRTRDTHKVMETQNPRRMSEAFLVGGVWPAQMPGDPDLPAEEVINCRCTVAYGVDESLLATPRTEMIAMEV